MWSLDLFRRKSNMPLWSAREWIVFWWLSFTVFHCKRPAKSPFMSLSHEYAICTRKRGLHGDQNINQTQGGGAGFSETGFSGLPKMRQTASIWKRGAFSCFWRAKKGHRTDQSDASWFLLEWG